MLYKKHSADVLNDADRFERILNWQLFAAEQETRLYGYDGSNPEIEWTPGDSIHVDPRAIPGNSTAFFTGGSFEGNFPRPMIEEYIDGDRYKTMRCNDCQVSWDDDVPCWVCGQIYPQSAVRIGYLDLIDEYMRPRLITFNETRELLGLYNTAPRPIRGRGLRIHSMVIDEANDFMEPYSAVDVDFTMELHHWTMLNPFAPEPYVYPSNTPPLRFPPRRREFQMPVVGTGALYDPRSADRGQVTPPFSWRFMEPSIPMPSMPEPVDYTDWMPSSRIWTNWFLEELNNHRNRVRA